MPTKLSSLNFPLIHFFTVLSTLNRACFFTLTYLLVNIGWKIPVQNAFYEVINNYFESILEVMFVKVGISVYLQLSFYFLSIFDQWLLFWLWWVPKSTEEYNFPLDYCSAPGEVRVREKQHRGLSGSKSERSDNNWCSRTVVSIR